MNPLQTIALALSLALSAGCGGRSVPSRFPPNSAAAPEACEAPIDDPTVALTSDPPLPGEATGAWRGLDPDAGPVSQGGHDHAR